tara:strand:- start:254 stop:1495 length:1242 start_codon:yes stop_codon:yes gene_type:complete
MTTFFGKFTLRGWLEVALGLAVALSLVCYFLLPTGKANNFPTYLMGILVLLVGLPWLDVLRRSWVLNGSIALAAYLALSLVWSAPLYDDEVHSLIGNGLLSVLFVVAVVIGMIRFQRFQVWLIQGVVLAASLSALVYLISAIYLGDAIDKAPLGRWLSPSVGAIGFGFAAILSVNLTLGRFNRRFKLLWGLLSLLLVAACIHLGIDYVSFALLAAVTALSLGRVWRMRESGRASLWMGVSFVLMVATILALNVVIDSGRQMIWSSVLDLIYNERVAFGFGIRSRPEYHVDCNLELVAAAADCAWRHPHNLYVSTMYYGGIIGIGGLILLMIASMSATLESHHPARWVTQSLLTYGFAVLMFDGNRLISKIDFIWLVFWLPVAFAAFLELDEKLSDDELEAGVGSPPDPQIESA